MLGRSLESQRLKNPLLSRTNHLSINKFGESRSNAKSKEVSRENRLALIQFYGILFVCQSPSINCHLSACKIYGNLFTCMGDPTQIYFR